MENSKRARKGKPRKQPRGSTYVEPKEVSQGLERVREAERRDSGEGSKNSGWDATRCDLHYVLDLRVEAWRKYVLSTRIRINASALGTRGRSRMSGNPHVRICAGGAR